ncbi:MAG: elongation factor 4 [Candidatus Kerfeldbacteria bacterium]|nr:elongation factor 4 [Candidatus Kerfeldbacteria bacterium]
MTEVAFIRNFSIVAHIDHGKSTLADRFLELAGAVSKREFKEQFLDSMDLERERGITIKLHPLRLQYGGYTLHLIDTPGHVDFTDEVSRSLAAVEGVILLVDATQGIQAQTMAHYRRVQSLGLAIVPVVNKVDLPNANTDAVALSFAALIGVEPDVVLRCSAKTGLGVREVLEAVVAKIPPPSVNVEAPLRARVIDSLYDDYLGVVAYVRVVDGHVRKGSPLVFLGSQATSTAIDVGTFAPQRVPQPTLGSGDIGYVVTGLKDLAAVRVGDTVAETPGAAPLSAFAVSEPVVFAGIFPGSGEDFPQLRSALEKLKLNDAALSFQPEHTRALGQGFRAGFLGLLHLDVVRERLEREFGLEPIFSFPSVAYRVTVRAKGGERQLVVHSPSEFPSGDTLVAVEEPWASVELLTPPSALSQLLQILRDARGLVESTENFADDQLLITAAVPLASILVDFYDRIKSASAGYASLEVTLGGYRPADVAKLDILLNGDAAESLAVIVPRAEAQRRGRTLVERLSTVLPREQFEIRIQAAVGSDILASARVAPLRKDVTAKLYGGDVTRKMKLLKKQKAGKKRLRQRGSVQLSAEVVTSLLKPDQG